MTTTQHARREARHRRHGHGDDRTTRDVDRIAQTLLFTDPAYRQNIDAFHAKRA